LGKVPCGNAEHLLGMVKGRGVSFSKRMMELNEANLIFVPVTKTRINRALNWIFCHCKQHLTYTVGAAGAASSSVAVDTITRAMMAAKCATAILLVQSLTAQHRYFSCAAMFVFSMFCQREVLSTFIPRSARTGLATRVALPAPLRRCPLRTESMV